MTLRTFTLTLAAPGTAPVPSGELRTYFQEKFSAYKMRHPNHSSAFISRYPAVQFKIIDQVPLVIGINEGADFLREIRGEPGPILAGGISWQVASRDALPHDEEFGSAEQILAYEFATPWLGLNQENFRKFYKLKGKPERDAFIRKLLEMSIRTLAKSLDCPDPGPVRCTVNLHFQKVRLEGTGTLAFTGKFTAGFRIPDYLGIGRSTGLGFGAVRQLPSDLPVAP